MAALLERDRRQGRPGVACAGPFPYHHAFEPSGGSGAPGRKRPLAHRGIGPSRSPQRHALEVAAPGQPGARQGPEPTQRSGGQQAGDGASLDSQGNLPTLLALQSLTWARYFLEDWTWRALRSRLEPMQKVARMLRSHEELILNWFRAKGEISSGAVEGLNNKIRVVTRRSYGFRTYDAMEIALYHTLGRLPEPDEFTHKFC